MQDMQEAIAEGERLLKDPSFDPNFAHSCRRTSTT